MVQMEKLELDAHREKPVADVQALLPWKGGDKTSRSSFHYSEDVVRDS